MCSVRRAIWCGLDGARYIMRPEFLINFMSLSPSAEEVRKSFATIFPTLLGIKLSNRMRDELFKEVIARVKEAFEISEGRARALASELADRLKGDLYKEYPFELGPFGSWLDRGSEV